MTEPLKKVPGKAWVVVFAGMAINLCLGILYAWSVWKGKLLATADLAKKAGFEKAADLVGRNLPGVDSAWQYLSDAQATWAYFTCGVFFALFMIPGGKIQDKFGPKVGATIGGLSLALGCIISGVTASFWGLFIGFGILGGIGMGIGYAAPTPAALKWFGPHKRGLIAGLVVGGYGGAALYIAPLGNWLIGMYGISGSFYALGTFFAAVTVVAGQLLSWPEPGYVPPLPPTKAGVAPAKAAGTTVDWAPSEIITKWQYFALVIMFIGTAQSGLLVIANAVPIMRLTSIANPEVAAYAFMLASFGGAINALGRVGTGLYSDKIGRMNAYTLNCVVAAVLLIATPTIIKSGSVFLLFVALGIAYWQYGGGLALMPAFTADFFGPKNLGMNYGLVFIGWGLAFFVPLLAGFWADYQVSIGNTVGRYDGAIYVSAAFLIISVILSRVTKRPLHSKE